MKTKNRFAKAFAISIIICLGLIYITNIKVEHNESTISGKIDNNEIQIKTDSLEVNDKLYIYTKTIIQSGIQHLISNL